MRKVPCPKCGGEMKCTAKACRGCSKPVQTYSRELGVSVGTIRRLGGVDKLRALAPEARALLLRPNYGNSQSISISMRSRKMVSRVSARFTTPAQEYAS